MSILDGRTHTLYTLCGGTHAQPSRLREALSGVRLRGYRFLEATLRLGLVGTAAALGHCVLWQVKCSNSPRVSATHTHSRAQLFSDKEGR